MILMTGSDAGRFLSLAGKQRLQNEQIKKNCGCPQFFYSKFINH